ncbi:MAG TPA: TetR/AcrR family transcriptional regulator [Pyrinomonadaceae bacterium]
MRRTKKIDPRGQRTRRQLGMAIVELIQEKRFDDITVQNVIDRAAIGRATFYSHYRDKEDLFTRQWERLLDEIARRIQWDRAGSDSFFPVAFVFGHFQQTQNLYRGLVSSGKADSMLKSGIEYLSHKLETELSNRPKLRLSVPIAIAANYLANEIFALLKWWLDNGMRYTPDEMDETI